MTDQLTTTTLLWSIGLIFLLAVAGLLIVRWRVGQWPGWTGFGPRTAPDGEHHPAKTLWDWLGLLIVPLVLGIGGLLLGNYQAEQQANREATQETVQGNIEATRVTAQSTVEADRLNANALEAYLDDMTTFVGSDRAATLTAEEVEFIAARTSAVLGHLDGARNGAVLRFLVETEMIRPLHNLELAGLDLRGADLSHLNLLYISMPEADLRGATLQSANLTWVDLEGANLSGANLRGVNFEEATLTAANLSGADIRYAQMAEMRNWAGASFDEVIYDNHTQCPPSFLLPESAYLTLDSARPVILSCFESDRAEQERPLALLLTGVETWNRWRQENPEVKPDLSGVVLVDMDLSGADLRGVNFEGAILLHIILADARYDRETRWPDYYTAELLAASGLIYEE